MKYGRFGKGLGRGLAYGLSALIGYQPVAFAQNAADTSAVREPVAETQSLNKTLRVSDVVDSTRKEVLRTYLAGDLTEQEVDAWARRASALGSSQAVNVDSTNVNRGYEIIPNSTSYNPFGTLERNVRGQEKGVTLATALAQWGVPDSEKFTFARDYMQRVSGNKIDLSKLVGYKSRAKDGSIINLQYKGDRKGLERILDKNGYVLFFNLDNATSKADRKLNEKLSVMVPFRYVAGKALEEKLREGREGALGTYEEILTTPVPRDTVEVPVAVVVGVEEGQGGKSWLSRHPYWSALIGSAIVGGISAGMLKGKSKDNGSKQPKTTPSGGGETGGSVNTK